MSAITTHVLDIARGKPAPGLLVIVEVSDGPQHWIELARGVTNDGGRIARFDPPLDALAPDVYRLRFVTGDYFNGLGIRSFYPEVSVVVQLDGPAQHYHIPLLLSPFGYSTYRGN